MAGRKLRILFVCKFFKAGSGDRSHMFALQRVLESRGHGVAHFAMHHPEEEDSPYADFFVAHVSYDELRTGTTFAGAGRAFCRTLYSVEAASKIKALVESFKPDLVHVHHLDTHLTYSVLRQVSKLGIPIVWTLHIYAPLCINYNLFDQNRHMNCQDCRQHRFYRPLLRRCKKGSLRESAMGALAQYFNYYVLGYKRLVNAFICPSDSVKQIFVNWGFSEASLHVIPNFTDPGSIQPTYGAGRYGLYAGRLVPEKGIDVLLAALRGTTLPFVFAGGGPLQDKVTRAIENDLGSRVTHLGFKFGTEYQEVVRNAQFLVVPSTWHEPFGLVVLDAFAHGKPVIAASSGGLADIVVDGRTGYLVDAGSASQLRARMRCLFDNPEVRACMGRAARRKVETEYHPSAYYERLMRVYAEVL